MVYFLSRKEVGRLPKQQGIKKIADNRKAFHDYFVLERYEAGIELAGTEVKSIRAGQVNLKDSFCTVMHKREILKLNARVMQDGVALVPLSLYFKDSRVKVELGLCKGKKLYDKRSAEAEKQSKRDIDRMMKERNI